MNEVGWTLALSFVIWLIGYAADGSWRQHAELLLNGALARLHDPHRHQEGWGPRLTPVMRS